MARVQVQVYVYDGDYSWQSHTSNEAEVKMENVRELRQLPWESICANLVQQTIDRHVTERIADEQEAQ